MLRFNKKDIMNWGSRLLMLAAIGFIVFRVRGYNIDLSILTSPVTIIGFGAVAVVIGFGVFLFSFSTEKQLPPASRIFWKFVDKKFRGGTI